MKLKIVATPEFRKKVKKLSKTYKNITKDLKKLNSILKENPKAGIELGKNCYKIRLANSSIPTGKSGGFRVITYYIDANNTIRLLYIFSKTEQENISNKELENLINKYI